MTAVAAPAARPIGPAPGLRPIAGRALLAWIALAWAASLFVGFEDGTTVLTLTGLLLLALAFRFRALGLVGAALLCTLDPVSRVFMLSGGLLRWNTLAYALVLGALAGWKRMGPFREPPSRWLAGFVLVLGAGLLWSLDPVEGALHALGVIAYWGLLFFLSRGEGTPEVWGWTAVICGAAAAGGMASLMIVYPDLVYDINANALSYFPLTAIFVASIAVCRGIRSKTQNLLTPILCAVNAGWVFLTGSRGSTLVAAVVIAYISWRLGGRAARLGLGLGVVLAVALAVNLFSERQERTFWRFEKLFSNEYSLSGRTSGRSDLVRAGWQLFLQRPLSGVGTGSFATRWTRLQDAPGLSAFKLGVAMQAHSGWIKTLAENGVPGFLLLAGFSLSFVATGSRLQSPGTWQFCLMVTLVLLISLVTTEFQAKGLWLLAAAGSLEIRRAGARVEAARRSAPAAPGGSLSRRAVGTA